MTVGKTAAWRLAIVLAASTASVALAQTERPQSLSLDAVPEVEVHLPPPVPVEPPRPAEIELPNLPAAPPTIAIGIPDAPTMPPRLSGTPDPEAPAATTTPGLPAVANVTPREAERDLPMPALPAEPPARPLIVAIPDTPAMPPRLSGTPDPEAPAVRVERVPAPPAIAIAPPPVPVVTPAIPAVPPAALVPPTVLPDRAGLAAAFETVWRAQSLPNSVMQGVRAFYDAPDATALWTSGGNLTARGRSVVALVDRAAEHGLDLDRFAKLRGLVETGSPEIREIATSVLVALYARDARGGRINPQQVSRLITATPTLPDTEDVLAGLKAATDVAAALEAYQPRHAGYRALKAKLAQMRAAQDVTGMVAPEEDTGRRRKRREPPNPVADVIANMERWRWLPTDLGAEHVFVNIPAFALTLKRSGAPDLTARVVVGKPQTQTPVFSDKMQFLVVNPYWNVPPSIALKEYLPLLQKNPYALQARGLEVISRGRVVDPATVDWSTVGRSVAIRQPPGERNALGHIKFMFPNQHAVYLHDTPSRGLFGRDMRAYSHGCVRVENPFRLAEAVLGGSLSEGRLRSMVGGPERTINLDRPLPVHLAYFTTVVDATGELRNYPDLYGHNRRVRALLGL